MINVKPPEECQFEIKEGEKDLIVPVDKLNKYYMEEISKTLKEILMRKERMNGNEWSIEKQWKYKDYECLITYASNSCIEDYRCGYVVFGDDDCVDTENILCHGGVTWYGWHDRLGKSVVGFDCAHYGDSLEICTLDYCVQQCESIVDQLLTLNKREDKNDT